MISSSEFGISLSFWGLYVEGLLVVVTVLAEGNGKAGRVSILFHVASELLYGTIH